MLRATLFAIASLCFVPAGAQHGTHRMHPDLMAPMNASMARMRHLPMSGNLDRDFAEMMAEHHRSGVEMARIELKYGKDPVLRQMARSIVSGQTREIHRLKRRARVLAGRPSTRPRR